MSEFMNRRLSTDRSLKKINKKTQMKKTVTQHFKQAQEGISKHPESEIQKLKI